MGNNNYASSHKYNFNGVIYEMISYDTNLSYNFLKLIGK